MLPVICSQPSSLLWTGAIYSILGDHCFWLAIKYTYFCDIYRGCSNNYAHDVLFLHFSEVQLLVHFTHVLQGCFTGTGAIIWLPQCQWSNPEVCGGISHMNPLGAANITTMIQSNPDSKVHGANLGPTWVLLAPHGLHVGPMNLAFKEHTPVCIFYWIYCSLCAWHGMGHLFSNQYKPYKCINPVNKATIYLGTKLWLNFD